MAEIFEDLFSSEESEKYKAIRDFYDRKDENINFKTELTQSEISNLTIIEFIDDYVNKEWGFNLELGKVIKLYKEQKVSHKRKGRAEWVEVLKGEKTEEKENRIRKILGI